MKLFTAAIVAGVIAAAQPARAATMESVSRIAFGPDNVLFAADWKEAKVHALTLGAATAKSDKPFNLTDFGESLEKAVGSSKIKVEDMAVRPGTGDVYIALSIGSDRKPAVVVAQSDGRLQKLDFASAKETSIVLQKAPDAQSKFWDRFPERSFTVTDMKWHGGRLYVAGLSSESFASTLRILTYPFTGKEEMASVGMYHTSHNQIETRAPIRAMTFAMLNGKDTLIAAYTCTPLVTIPLDALKNGAHVTGKTIAELGFGNTPANLLMYDAKGADGKTATTLLVTNVERNAATVSLDSIAAADAKPAMSQMVEWGKIAGVEAVDAPLSGVVGIGNLNDDLFVTLRRDAASGNLQLVSMGKQFKLRLSDFISEYDFKSYAYPEGFQKKYIKPVQDGMMQMEGFGDLVAKEK